MVLGGCNFGSTKTDTDIKSDGAVSSEKDSTADSSKADDSTADSSKADEFSDSSQPEEESSDSSGTESSEENKDGKTDTKNPSKATEKPSSLHTGGKGGKTYTAHEYNVISDSSLKAQWAIIDDVAEAAQKYYTENFNKTRLITKDGYLYNYAAGERVDVTALVAEGNLESKYINKGCEVLLLDADKMKNYSTLTIKNSESGLTVFAALKNPKDNTYLIATSKSAGGYLTASQYASLLNGYYQNHGSCGTLYSGSDEYSRIISFISMYESKYENYFVRSITVDNKYAVAVLSPQSNSGSIKQYILKRNGNIWEVVMEGLENESRAPVAVNKKLPDFNLGLLPLYSISDYKNSINKHNGEITSILKSDGYISSDNDIKYVSSAGNFGYAVLKNEVKFVFLKEENGWNVQKCSSSSEAVKIMTSVKKSAPTFVVLDS